MIEFKIVKHISTLKTSPAGWTKELNLVKWGGHKEPQYDIRNWNPDHTKMSKGVSLSEAELKKLIEDFNA